MTNSPPIALEDRHDDGGRLSSPSAARNREVIAQTLAALLPQGGRVLEIASGTGEHALACVTARPDLRWQPSEPDPRSRISIDGWASDAGGRIAPALALDVMADGWWQKVPSPVDAVFCANMIHIAPWAAAEGLVEGAGKLLSTDGFLVLYGPFLEGEATAPSNLVFDQSLKARNSGWGVRALNDVAALAEAYGFTFDQRIAMPANNLVLAFRKRGP